MVNGLLYMKHHGLAHHDVSLENVAITTNDNNSIVTTISTTIVQIIDLGMAIHVPTATCYSFGCPFSPLADNPGSCHGHTTVGSKHRSLPVYLSPQPSSGKRSFIAPEVQIYKPYDI